MVPLGAIGVPEHGRLTISNSDWHLLIVGLHFDTAKIDATT